MGEENHIFAKKPFYDLLHGEREVNITHEVPEFCVDHIEHLGMELRKTFYKIAKDDGRNLVKGQDIQKGSENTPLFPAIESETPRIAFAHVKTLLKDPNGEMKISNEAVSFLQGAIENYLKRLGEIAALITYSLGKKTIDEAAIQRALLTFSDVKINFIEFLEEIFSVDELRAVCAARNLIKGGTKHELANRIFCRTIVLEDVLSNFQFSEIQTRMLKSRFPVPANFQNIFSWIESPSKTEICKDVIGEGPGEQKPTPSVVEKEETIPQIPTISTPDMSKQEQQEELAILEKSIDFTQYFSPDLTRINLKELIRDLLPIRALNKINLENELDLDVEGTDEKEKIVERFLKTGISVVYFLQEFTTDILKGLLRTLKLKLSGNKVGLLQRLLNSVNFTDYDVTHNDLILLLQGKEFLEEQLAKKKKDDLIRSKIRNYTGSIKLELLVLLEQSDFILTEKILKEKYASEGHDPFSFFGVIAGLLRDGLVFVKPGEEEISYTVPESIRDIVRETLVEVNEKKKELEGIINELPPSSLILLNYICGYGGPVNLLEIREKFSQSYRSRKTWSKARQLLKERNLIKEQYDEESEQTVLFSPKLICPIISGIIATKKTELLQEEQKEFKEEISESEKDWDLTQFSRGILDLLYLITNSGGSVNKSALRTCFTSPPGVQYSDKSFLRFLLVLKNAGLIIEEIDTDTNSLMITIDAPDLEAMRIKLEDLLFDLHVESFLESLSEGSLAIVKIIADNGNSILVKELRRIFTKYFSSRHFLRVFNALEGVLISEGISNQGDSLSTLPGKFLPEIQQFFIKNPLELEEKAAEKLTADDFLLNYYMQEKLANVAKCYEMPGEKDAVAILKSLLYDLKAPFLSLAEEIIPKTSLIQFCRDLNLTPAKSKYETLQRIISSGALEINENLVIEGPLQSKIAKSSAEKVVCEEETTSEKTIEEELSAGSESLLDKDLIVEAIAKTWSNEDLREKAKNLNVRPRGNRLFLVNEILFNSKSAYDIILKDLLTPEVINYIIKEVGDSSLTAGKVIKQVSNGELGFPIKNAVFSLVNLLDSLSQGNLLQVAKTIKLEVAGTKQEIIQAISEVENVDIEDLISMILRQAPEWIQLLKTKNNLVIDEQNSAASILGILGHTPKPKSIPKKQGYELTLLGLQQLVKENFEENIVESCLGDTGVSKLEELSDPTHVVKFLSALGKPSLGKIVNLVQLPIETKNKITRDLVMLICEKFGIAPPEAESLTERIGKLKLEQEKALEKGVEFFAEGDVKGGFQAAYGSVDHFKDIIKDKDFSDVNVQGVFFEASIFHALKRLNITKNLAKWGIKKVTPFAKFQNFQEKPEEADGEITVKLTVGKALEEFYSLYDCKSRKDGYSLDKDFLKLMKYLSDAEIDSTRQGLSRKYRFLIIFSSGFSVDVKTWKKKMQEDPNYSNYALILWDAKALRKLCLANHESEGELEAFIAWNTIFDSGERLILINSEKIESIIRNAKKKSETALARKNL